MRIDLIFIYTPIISLIGRVFDIPAAQSNWTIIIIILGINFNTTIFDSGLIFKNFGDQIISVLLSRP